MTITLPDEMRAELEREALAEGMATVDSYILAIYLRAKHTQRSTGERFDRTDEENEIARQHVYGLIEAGLNSGPPIIATPEFWSKLRSDVEERLHEPSAVQ